jgi:hypothetical protein
MLYSGSLESNDVYYRAAGEEGGEKAEQPDSNSIL